jgi:superoxide dismutase, Fe-Mn family
MAYDPKNYENLIGMKGLSEQILRNHFALYQGYVTNVKKVSGLLSNFLKENKMTAPEYAELKRRFAWEFNGMKLHELYFENIAKEGKAIGKDSELYARIAGDFGSYENWEKDFLAVLAMRGVGWGILYYDAGENHLFNSWINEHDTGHLSGSVPLLVIDVFEHAFMIDYGLKRADYSEMIIKQIDWDIVEKRFENN